MANSWTILVLGGTGLVGSYCLRTLKSRLAASAGLKTRGRSVRVVATARSADKAKQLAQQGLAHECRVLDLDQPRTFRAALQGCDAVFFVNGYTAAMMHQAKWFIDAAAAAGVQHFVHLTADPPRSTFVQHIAWHELIDNYIEMKLPSKGTFLQPGFFTENLVSYNGRSRVNGGELSVMGVPGSVLPFISCEDIGEVAASCLLDPDRHAGKSYRLFAEARSIEDAVSTISSTIGLTPLTVKYVTPQDIYNEALALDAQDGGRLAYFASLRHNLQDATELTARARKAPGGKVFVPPVYPEVIREIIGRPPLTVVQWAVRNRRYFKL